VKAAKRKGFSEKRRTRERSVGDSAGTQGSKRGTRKIPRERSTRECTGEKISFTKERRTKNEKEEEYSIAPLQKKESSKEKGKGGTRYVEKRRASSRKETIKN